MKTKQLLAALLSSAMVLGTMAVPVFAADFANDIAAGDTVTLTEDVALTQTVEITKDVTIDLNHHNITATDARALYIMSGNVTITGAGTISTVVTSGTKFANSSSVIRVGDGNKNSTLGAAKLTIGKDVTVSSDYCYGVSTFGNNKADIELVVDGTVSVSGVQSAISGNGLSTAATKTTINGTVTATQDNAIYHPGKGTLTVNGNANISGPGAIEAKAGTITINGGNITATASNLDHTGSNNGTSTSGYALAAVNNKAYYGEPTFVVKNGTITGAIGIIDDANATTKNASISITGGTFSKDPQTYVAAGKSAVKSTNGYTVQTVTVADLAAQMSQAAAQLVDNEVYTAKSAVSGNTYDQVAATMCYTDDNATKTFNVETGSKGTFTITLNQITGDTHFTGDAGILCGLIITDIPANETVTVTVAD